MHKNPGLYKSMVYKQANETFLYKTWPNMHTQDHAHTHAQRMRHTHNANKRAHTRPRKCSKFLYTSSKHKPPNHKLVWFTFATAIHQCTTHQGTSKINFHSTPWYLFIFRRHSPQEPTAEKSWKQTVIPLFLTEKSQNFMRVATVFLISLWLLRYNAFNVVAMHVNAILTKI